LRALFKVGSKRLSRSTKKREKREIPSKMFGCAKKGPSARQKIATLIITILA